MNEMLKKFLSLLLSTVLVLSLLPLTALGADNGEEAGNGDEWQFVPGMLPEEGTYGYPEKTAEDELGLDGTALPASYDSREYGYITPVKDQNPYGLCWTFASLGALEANLKKSNVGTFDFSEAHMAYATATYTFGGKTVNADQGFRNHPLTGGNREISSAYLMRGTTMSGTVDEDDDPYSEINGSSPFRDPAITASKTKTYSVRDVIFLTGGRPVSAPAITSADAETLKNAVMEYGAVQVGMYYDEGASYYNKSTAAYYYDGKAANENDAGMLVTNHAVLLVGWDDNYSKSKFCGGHQPSKDGAWLIKNNWGTSWGNQGYFWISYEDTNAPLYGAAYVGADKWNKSTDSIYESDYRSWGWYGGRGSGALYAKSYPVAKGGQSITGVRVFMPDVTSGNVTLEADVVSSFGGSFSSSYQFNARGSATIHYPGWYTIKLNTPVPLGAAGSSFAVVVRVTGSNYIGYDHDNQLPSGVGAYWCSSGGTLSQTETNLGIKAVAMSASLSVKFVDNEFKAVITAPANSMLIAASYDSSGRQVEVKTFTYTSAVTNKTVSTGLARTAGYTYKAILVNKSTFAPLCEAKSIKG